MSDKAKKSTENQFMARTSGLALSIPIILVLGVALVLVNSIVAVVILGALLTGDTVVAPYIGWLILSLTVGFAAMFVLFRAVFRYAAGIGKLRGRLRGIREEHERVERLMEGQTAAQDDELLMDDDDENNQQIGGR